MPSTKYTGQWVNTLNNPVTGAQYALQGAKLVFRPELRIFLLAPLLVNVFVFVILIWVGLDQFKHLVHWLLPETGWLTHLRWLFWVLIGLAVALLVFNTFTMVADLIAAPFNGLLAEKVEKILTGDTIEQKTSCKEIVKDIIPSLLSEIRKISYVVIRAFPLLLMFLIPGVNLLAPFLWLLFSAWYLSLEYADYPMSNNGLRFREQLKRLRKTRLATLGFGATIALLTLTPVVNFIAMPAGVAGATAFWHRDLTSR